MRKMMICFLSFMVAAGVLQAQSPKEGPVLQFEKTHHDFGKVKEENGPVAYTYKFKNVGTKPLMLTNVQPSCGCTTPEWTKEEIQPGKEGYVKATFDVVNRPGNFHKSITIYSNSEPNMSVISFSGEVIPRTKTVEDSFPTALGNLRFEQSHVNYGVVFNNNKDTVQYLNMINTGTTPITIKGITSQNPYISTKSGPVTLQPKQRAKFPVSYQAIMVKDYGLIFDNIKLITDDTNTPEKSVNVIADIKQYIPAMSDAEKAKAAKVFFPKSTHDFGDVKQGESVTTEFAITNKGKQDLLIYKVKTTCGCTASEPAKSKLKPGESSTVKVTFNSAGKHGKEEKSITVYTNDPTNPEPALKIQANIIGVESDSSN